jgi:hypothetical protein
MTEKFIITSLDYSVIGLLRADESNLDEESRAEKTLLKLF